MTVVEERSYTLHTQYSPKDYFEIYLKEGFALQSQVLQGFAGYFITEVGDLNTIVSLWRYPDFNARLERRALLAANPEWQSFLDKVRPMIRVMSSRLLIPTAFSPQY
jgi:hypothetical protein